MARSPLTGAALELFGPEPEAKSRDAMSAAEKSDAILHDRELREAILRVRAEGLLTRANELAQILQKMVYSGGDLADEVLARKIVFQSARTWRERNILKALLKRKSRGRPKSPHANFKRFHLLNIRDIYRTMNPNASNRQFAEWYLYEWPGEQRKKRGSPQSVEAEIKTLKERLVRAEKDRRACDPKSS